MDKIIQISELLSAVKWYFQQKNLSLKNALALRCPLSTEDQKNLRLYYSQYFAGLLSATELLLKEYPNRADFKKSLEEKLSFDNFSDGELNYAYLRELRNSIIHRGLDICSAAHTKNNFPLVISPSPVTNRGGSVKYNAFGYYLIELIEKCESVIGEVFLNHFDEFDLFNVRLPQEQIVILSNVYITNSTAIPDWAKVLALENIGKIDYDEIHQISINKLVDALKENVLSTLPYNV